jgi:hypothetical protein
LSPPPQYAPEYTRANSGLHKAVHGQRLGRREGTTPGGWQFGAPAFAATRLVAPQSRSTPVLASADRWMQACNRPPLPNASPDPANVTVTPAVSPSLI